jgi:hypothetical protein
MDEHFPEGPGIVCGVSHASRNKIGGKYRISLSKAKKFNQGPEIKTPKHLG